MATQHSLNQVLTQGRQLQCILVKSWIICETGSDVLNGQISVGMFLSWRMRWEMVWAVYCQCHLDALWSVNWRTAMLLFLSIVSISSPESLRAGKKYRHRTAHAQRLPHEQLRACPHEHLLGGAHHHHARGLHSQDSRSLEHVVGRSSVGMVEWRVSRVVGELVVSSQGRWGSSMFKPEKAVSLIGCGGQCVERVSPSPTSLRHDLQPPAIAATPTPSTPQNNSQSCLTTTTEMTTARSS